MPSISRGVPPYKSVLGTLDISTPCFHQVHSQPQQLELALVLDGRESRPFVDDLHRRKFWYLGYHWAHRGQVSSRPKRSAWRGSVRKVQRWGEYLVGIDSVDDRLGLVGSLLVPAPAEPASCFCNHRWRSPRCPLWVGFSHCDPHLNFC